VFPRADATGALAAAVVLVTAEAQPVVARIRASAGMSRLVRI
jgi:hypothetical protein